ncbi:DUF262 domain-containing protein [Isoptericola nanjingensis]|uniref:DUF262 domain-containing protein n=1 Tax=Isoptericola nanjingensis TaxID=903413 RepID=UPI003D199BEE
MEDTDVEDRREAEAAIAEGLAMLSRSSLRPTEVDVVRSFEPEEVSFSGGLWLDSVEAVQDWLRLESRLDSFGTSTSMATSLFAGLSADRPQDAFAVSEEDVVLTPYGLDLLRSRVDRALQLRDAFVGDVEDGSVASATASWIAAWDDVVDETVSGPIRAKAEVWSIHDFASRAKSRRLDLSPSYQRGEVWPTRDAQLLIESILRGIPLPSVIILRPKSLAESPFEVVDGKQRLTSILRFIGMHPSALRAVEEASREHPGHDLSRLFQTDYPAFRNAWTEATGEKLTTTRERELFFPFKLAGRSPGLLGALAELGGKYYHQIAGEIIRVGGEESEVRDVFESTTDYKVPVIEYMEATPRQIHEVFNLYNKQGKHLNAEEIRNAVYHEVDLMRALAVAAGDGPTISGAAPFLAPVTAEVEVIAEFLATSGVAESRYRRTKVLSWLFSMAFLESTNDDGTPRKLSTAHQINALLDRAAKPGSPFSDQRRIADAVRLVATAMRAHQASDVWAPRFKDGRKGEKWQDLQLVASLLGVVLATAILPDGIEGALRSRRDNLLRLSGEVWTRPTKTQTSEQWDYIATVALGILTEIGASPAQVDQALRDGYLTSSVRALTQVAASTGARR